MTTHPYKTLPGSQPLVSAAEEFGIDANWLSEAGKAMDYEDYLGALHAIWRAEQQVKLMKDEAARMARVNGATWQQIADRLGLTKQGAAQRFGD